MAAAKAQHPAPTKVPQEVADAYDEFKTVQAAIRKHSATTRKYDARKKVAQSILEEHIEPNTLAALPDGRLILYVDEVVNYRAQPARDVHRKDFLEAGAATD